MFTLLLAALLVAVAIHIARSEERTPRRIGELGLLYLLAGYCGVPMVAVSLITLVSPDHVTDFLGFEPGHPFQDFLGFAYLGMSLVATLALRYRGVFLVGPAVAWIVFFGGATWVHLKHFDGHGAPSHADIVHIFASHGLIAVLLAVALFMSGVWRAPA
jgi:hypothetical protein